MGAGYDNYGAGVNGLKQRVLLHFGISRLCPRHSHTLSALEEVRAD
jgi:hypothetical protein